MYTFILRNMTIKIPEDEFLSLTDEPWYLSNILKYSSDSDNELHIHEDYGVFMSIIESLKYKDLIILDKVNPILMYYVADKWCVPSWLLDKLKIHNSKHKLENILTKYLDQSLNSKIKKCINCNEGFHVDENTNSACCFHTGYIICTGNNERVWKCCYQPHNSIGCKIGYHVSETPNWIHLQSVVTDLKKLTLNSIQ